MVWMLLTSVITSVIMIFLGGLLLWLTAKYFFKVGDKFTTALKVAVIVGAVGFVLNLIGMYTAPGVIAILGFLVSIALSLFLVKKYYKLEWGKAALVWLVWFVLNLVADFIIGFAIGLVMAPLIAAEMFSALA